MPGMRSMRREYYTDDVMQDIERIAAKAKELNSEFFAAEYRAA